MFKFFVALSLLIGGYSWQAQGNVSVELKLEPDTGHKDSSDNLCPYVDRSVAFDLTNTGDSNATVHLEIKCVDEKNENTSRWNENDVKLDASSNVKEVVALSDGAPKINTGDSCKAIATGGANLEQAFTVGFRHRGGAPDKKIWPCGPLTDVNNSDCKRMDESNDDSVAVGSITAGKQFTLTNLHITEKIPFFDLLLRECTASTDPWLFWEETGRTDENGDALDNVLHRVYPTSTTNELNKTSLVDKVPIGNSNSCLGAYDGQLKGLVTIGDDHRGCKFKVVKEDVKGADSIAEYGADDPQLTAATVSVENSKVMVHTGKGHPDLAEAQGAERNAPKPGIGPNITVYVSTNRGFTWQKSPRITEWTPEAGESGITTNSNDNTRNMAMVRFEEGEHGHVWWRIIKGQ